MPRPLLYIVLFPLIAIAMQACKGDDEPSSRIPRSAVYDFVTLRESSEEGSVLTMRKNADSPLITYFSDIDFSRIQTIHDGDRLIICYDRIGGEIYTSGNIVIYGYVQLSASDQKMLTGSYEEYSGWTCPPMKANALWRTGHFINLDADISVFQAHRPETLVIVADQATIDDGYPELYIYYKNEEKNDGENPYRIYASFDISAVWSKPSCRGVIVNYPDASGFASAIFQK